MLLEWQKRVREGVLGSNMPQGLFRAHEKRIQLYREGYWLRVSESLREDFPLTERLLGVAGLEARMREFLALRRAYELELGELTSAFAAWLRDQGSNALARSVALDSLAVESRRAPEVAEGPRLGLHPSVRFLAHGDRSYVFWRDAQGDVLSERIPLATLELLMRFREPVAGVGQEFSSLRETLDECAEAGILVLQK